MTVGAVTKKIWHSELSRNDDPDFKLQLLVVETGNPVKQIDVNTITWTVETPDGTLVDTDTVDKADVIFDTWQTDGWPPNKPPGYNFKLPLDYTLFQDAGAYPAAFFVKILIVSSGGRQIEETFRHVAL